MPRHSRTVVVALDLVVATYTARNFLTPSDMYAMVIGSGCGFLPYPYRSERSGPFRYLKRCVV